MKMRVLLVISLMAVSLTILASPAIGTAASSLPPLPLFARVTVNVDPTPDASVMANIHVPADEVHQGDLVVVMGDAVIEGTVTGELVVVMGSLKMNGTADSVVSILSRTQLGETARIRGDLVNIGWSLEQATGSRVGGEFVNISFMNIIPGLGAGLGGLAGLVQLIYLIKLFKLAILFVVVLLISALFPRRLSLMAGAIPVKWGWALLAGLLGYAGLIVGCVILGLTIIGIPLAILLGFAMKVVKWLGLATIFFLLGQTAGRNVFHRDLSHLACVLTGYLVFAIASLVPFVGDLFALFTNLLAVGIVIVTRVGTSEEPQAGSSPPVADGGVPGAPGSGIPAPPVVEPPVAPPREP
jgi:hypothetical protein